MTILNLKKKYNFLNTMGTSIGTVQSLQLNTCRLYCMKVFNFKLVQFQISLLFMAQIYQYSNISHNHLMSKTKL